MGVTQFILLFSENYTELLCYQTIVKVLLE